MAWEKIKYTKEEINKAGKILIENNITKDKEDYAISILDNWRAVLSQIRDLNQAVALWDLFT